MKQSEPAMAMPELLVFSKFLVIGFLVAEVWRISYYFGINVSKTITFPSVYIYALAIVGTLLCISYTVARNGHLAGRRIFGSFRFDLLAIVVVGIGTNELSSPWLSQIHDVARNTNSHWGTLVYILLFTILISSLFRHYLPKVKKPHLQPQLHFISDEEIVEHTEDVLASESQAKSFAEAVLASSADSGLVFGIDGPWGIGKTSFVNLAQKHWMVSEEKPIVCRFEPLRYASDPVLADRLIRDLSTTIQREVFVPEFRPAASRYTRLIKGKADMSFLGFKLSLAPSQETIDELLEDIDGVLKRTGRRVILVIDDLDRLDSKAINNVLFATQRTFKISHVTYILCYDTEILIAGAEDRSKAREFLEKFVTVKFSIFIDSTRIRDFLVRDWKLLEGKLVSVPSDTMLKLSAILHELASLLDGDLAAEYLSFVGDLRKVKRFVNSLLLMQIEKADLARLDFSKRDLINLVLLHLNFPGVFRRIYTEETEGRRGRFSVYRNNGQNFNNSEEFSSFIEKQEEGAKFLLKQLFDVSILGLADDNEIDEATFSSRACFNESLFRNLEDYLKLIVRFYTPEPQNTFIFYQDAVERVRNGTRISTILMSPEFQLENGEYTHDKFWTVLVNNSHDFTHAVAEEAIDTLVDYLPRYSMSTTGYQGLRSRSIYNLVRLLDQAGWGRTSGRRLPNTPANIVEIAWRIFGENSYKNSGLIETLVDEARGVLGWYDLVLLRLTCSADRLGQLYNVYGALIRHEDENAATTGLVNNLALLGMRKFSQDIFGRFKATYIEKQKNFLSDVDKTPDYSFFSASSTQASRDRAAETHKLTYEELVSLERSFVKSFVIYQLSNSGGPTGAGVGCGYYNEGGDGDARGIAISMNRYIFDFCFNPELNENNILHFLDHCLSNLTHSIFAIDGEMGYTATKGGIPGGLDPMEMGRYWNRHGDFIQQKRPTAMIRKVITPNYKASYSEDLIEVFPILDALATESTAANSEIKDAIPM